MFVLETFLQEGEAAGLPLSALSGSPCGGEIP